MMGPQALQGGRGAVPLLGEASELPKCVSLGHPCQVGPLPSSGSSPFISGAQWRTPQSWLVPLPPGSEQHLPELEGMVSDLQ